MSEKWQVPQRSGYDVCSRQWETNLQRLGSLLISEVWGSVLQGLPGHSFQSKGHIIASQTSHHLEGSTTPSVPFWLLESVYSMLGKSAPTHLSRDMEDS